VRFLDFAVDPAFGHCIDGLLRVDLACLKPAKRARYLGPDCMDVTVGAKAETFLSSVPATVLN